MSITASPVRGFRGQPGRRSAAVRPAGVAMAQGGLRRHATPIPPSLQTVGRHAPQLRARGDGWRVTEAALVAPLQVARPYSANASRTALRNSRRWSSWRTRRLAAISATGWMIQASAASPK